MQQLGQYLKSEREKRGIRLEEIASSTKINIQNLILIEEDRWSELPQEPFIRGFITAYAKYLGLDPQETLTRFYQSQKSHEDHLESTDGHLVEPSSSSSAPPQAKTPDFPHQLSDTSSKLKKFNLETPKQVKGIAFILTLVLVAGFAITRLMESSRENQGTNPPLTSSTVIESPTTTNIEISTSSTDPNSSSSTIPTGETTTSSSSTTTVPPPSTSTSTTATTLAQNTSTTAPSAPVTTTPPVANSEQGHSVAISVKYRTWSKLVVDDEPPVETYLEPGAQVTYQAKNKIKLVLGNSTGSHVVYNGQENKGKKYSGTIRYYIFPKGSRFPQDIPKKKESEETSSEEEGVPLQENLNNNPTE